MPQIEENEFTLYSFTDEEMALAADYNELQLKYIRMRRAQVAIEKCNMRASGLSDAEYIKRQEYLAGMLAAYDVLLTSYEATSDFRKQLAIEAVARSASVVSTFNAKTAANSFFGNIEEIERDEQT